MTGPFSRGRDITFGIRASGTGETEVSLASLTGDEGEVGLQQTRFDRLENGHFELKIPTNNLNPGEYRVKVAAQTAHKLLFVEDSFVLT
jgi:hypothetical protein